jgi:spore coat polysaccharide biosynthesis protein SpsF (cytidylyltransferase family)
MDRGPSRRVVAIIQARLGSSRFPRKTLALLSGSPIVAHVVRRVRAVPEVSAVVAAIPFSDDLALTNACHLSGVDRVIYGSEQNVLLRFCHAAALMKADVVMRVTGDCPLLSSVAASDVIRHYREDVKSRRFWSNDTTRSGWPDGTDVEVFSSGLLSEAQLSRDKTPSDCEHVTSWMRRTLGASVGVCERQKDTLSTLKLSIDTPEDLIRVQRFCDDDLYPREWGLSC